MSKTIYGTIYQRKPINRDAARGLGGKVNGSGSKPKDISQEKLAFKTSKMQESCPICRCDISSKNIEKHKLKHQNKLYEIKASCLLCGPTRKICIGMLLDNLDKHILSYHQSNDPKEIIEKYYKLTAERVVKTEKRLFKIYIKNPTVVEIKK